ncbi:MAG: hypothetical protein A2W91_11025 [Bacteroidetes bacterium GWF2_38_335]|nr:MAG: hypothetical protein A2W91_11025 [Bacteroidetes bacterium GWF2_38_335]OFY81766.1 MAG: hypothetical protein A2281_06015 [Bacteroidetes bacterium RIFOXYA12_FULL_38_20]HBS87836.1 carbohydrate-binding family 9-like protein [Bacteroidales bacterium]
MYRLIFIFAVLSVQGIAQNQKYYLCQRSSDKIVIDGGLSEKSWQNALWSDCFVDIEGDKQPVPEFSTRMKMIWDDSCLYIAAEIVEPDIWATLTERESVIFYDNDFEVFIDPDGDTHNYAEFEINAFGTEWDLLLVKPYRNGGPPLIQWDIDGVKSAVKIHGTINKPGDKDDKWIVEMAIPFKSLFEISIDKNAPEIGEYWRMNFSRVQWKTQVVDGKYVKLKNETTGKNLPEQNWVWSPQGAIDMHRPEKWGYVQFSNLPAGSEKDSIVKDPDGEILAQMWNMYEKQKHYFMQHRKFNPDMEHSPNVKLDCCDKSFEILYYPKDREYYWSINEDGLIRKNVILKH